VRFHPDVIQPKKFSHQWDRHCVPATQLAIEQPVGKATTAPTMDPATANATMNPDGSERATKP